MPFQRIYKIFLVGGVLGFFLLSLSGGFLVFASEKSAQEQKQKELQRIHEEWKKYQSTVQEQYSPRIQTQQKRLEELKIELEQSLQGFDTHQKETEEYEKAMKILQERLNTLKGQLESLSKQLELTRKKVRSTEEQIAVRESELAKVMEEKEKISVEAEIQKNIVMDYFSLLQTDSESFTPTDITSGLKVILSSDSFTKNLREEMHLTALETTARTVFHNLEGAMAQLEEVDYLLSRERDALKTLYARLKEDQESLALQQNAQKVLLEQTEGEEKRFAALLAESRQQMNESSRQIAELQKDVASLQEKANLLRNMKITAKKDMSKQKIQEILENNESLYASGDEFEEEENQKRPFSWPVEPKKITTPFHDESYQHTFGMIHNAIDVRAAQGTDIKAPAPGYVYKVQDNGMGYSYIILIHKNNLMTVYGHVSGFNVTEGDLVQQFDIIGKTGGAPGTKGAGLQTTGPHLHFEVWENGAAKDPLDFLPIDELKPEDVPQRYLLEYKGKK